MKEATELLLGDYTIWFYMIWYFFTLLGFALSKAIAFNRRGNRTKFDLNYFWKDNRWDIIIGIFMTGAACRFHEDLLRFIINEEVLDKMFIAFAYGFLYSTLFQLLRKTNFGSIFKLPVEANGQDR